MSDIKWTKSQLDAIKSRGNVVVSASAGTGKTEVLSNRCIGLLLDVDCPADIDKILVLTFTEDAAAEMKERITQTLRQQYRQTRNERLREQLRRIEIADISTIHSFCSKLVKNNFFRLGVDPDFSIINEDEQKLLKAEILSFSVERAWEIPELCVALAAMLEDENADLKYGILKIIDQINCFVSSLVCPEDWFKKCYEICSGIGEDSEAEKQCIFATLKITEIFIEEYKRRKKELRCLDFSDLERLALKLLLNDDGSASETAKEIQEHYQYVFVDEYQDVSKLQDKIIELVSNGSNLFIVGDGKQSIYSWRQASPELFIEKINSPKQKNTKSIFLNDNFRCRKEIIDFANMVFKQLINQTTAGIDYDDTAALKLGADYYLPFDSVCKQGKPVELHLISSNTQANEINEDYEPEDKAARQAAVIAKRIQKLVGNETAAAELNIYDKKNKTTRPVQYGDIVILMRSPKSCVNDYVDIFRKFNIPVESGATSGYLNSTEINDCLCVLKVLDNPICEIELATIMRSPLFGFTDEQLLKIRQEGGNSSFYNCLLKYHKDGKDCCIKESITKMFETLDIWRQDIMQKSLPETVWKILRYNDFLSFASALPGGTQKRADLLKLYDKAIEFEKFPSAKGNPSLSRFVDFIERLKESDSDWSQAETDWGSSKSVRIISIHGSKGLEYPVVFMPEMHKGFNTMDLKGKCIFNEKFGIGFKVSDETEVKKEPSELFEKIKESKASSMIAEELNLLYVAMTRAREKLIIVADTSSQDKELCEYFKKTFDKLNEIEDIEGFNSWLCGYTNRKFIDWIIAALKDTDQIKSLAEGKAYTANEGLFDAFLIPAEQIDFEPKPVHSSKKELINQESIESIRERLSRRYKYEAVLSLPVKESVSAISHRDDEFKVDLSGKSYLDYKFTDTSSKQDPRTIGTATHFVFEQLPLDKPPQKADVKQVVDKLLSSGAITEQIADCIDSSQILRFFDTEPGRLIFQPNSQLKREMAFTIGIPPAQCGYDLPQQQLGDDIIVQGIIDLVIIRPEGAIIVDFKTDNINAASVAEKAKDYQKQLLLYSYAAGKILKSQIASKWLYFLRPMIAYKI